MTEGKGKDKEKEHPSEENFGDFPQEDIQADDGQNEIVENAAKQNSDTSKINPPDEFAEPNDLWIAEQSESPEAAEKISEEMQAVEDFDLNLLLDIPLEITVELGRAKIQIQELFDLGPGSTVSLSKLEGEPVDILANEKLIARGEVVLQNKKYGIRITEITSRMNRINSIS
jgi:flagellar motor switch protein FliN/FliY